MSGGESSRRQSLTLLATGLGLFMIFLDATIVNVALPDIQARFDVGEEGLQWVVAAYSLTFGMFMMTSATAADRRGRRKTYVAGIVVFAIASVGCGLATSVTMLNVFRGVQGVGAAMVNVTSLALVGAAYTDPAAKAKAIGAWTGIASVGLAIGPTLGGVLTEQLGWRSIFLVNPVFAVLAIVLTVLFVTESRDETPRRFDLAGQVLFIVAIGGLTYALVQGPQAGWLSLTILPVLAGSLVLIGLFVATELRVTDPMMDVRVFRDHVYTTAIVTIFAVLFSIYGTLLVITQYLQNVRGYSPEEAGIIMLSMTAPTVVIAPLSGRLAARLGPRRPALTGVAFLLAGLVVLAVGTGGALLITVVGLACLAAGAGLAITPVTSIAMSSIDPARSGMASGILSVQRALGSTAGFAIMGTVLAAVLAATLPGAFSPYLTDQTTLDEAVHEVVEDANPNAVASLIGPAGPLPDTVTEQTELVDAADGAFVDGIRAALAVAALVTALAGALGWVRFPRTATAAAEDELDEAEQLDSAETRGRAGRPPT